MLGNMLVQNACGHLPQPQPLRQLQLGRLGRSRRAFCSSLAPAPPPGCAPRAQGLAPSHNASEEPGGAGGSRVRGGRSGPEGAGWGPNWAWLSHIGKFLLAWQHGLTCLVLRAKIWVKK